MTYGKREERQLHDASMTLRDNDGGSLTLGPPAPLTFSGGLEERDDKQSLIRACESLGRMRARCWAALMEMEEEEDKSREGEAVVAGQRNVVRADKWLENKVS